MREIYSFLHNIYSYIILLILFSLCCKYGNFIQKLHQKKIATLVLFMGRFKVESVPEMINQEVLTSFMYKPV